MKSAIQWILFGSVAVATMSVEGQQVVPAPRQSARTWTPTRTASGAPDIQGVWNYGTMTPLERPAQWAGKESLTPEEATAYEKQTVSRRDENAAVTAGPDWWELQNNVLKNRRTSLVIDPPDGRVPATTTGYQARQQAGGRGRGNAYEGPEVLSLQDRCIAWPAAGPPYQPTVYNNNVQIVQSPGYIMLLSEMIHVARIVRMDGSPHGAMPRWYGDSRGHFEGDTLVVDTVNFNGRLNFRGSGQNLHLIERFTRTGPDTMTYRYTVDDPAVWTSPWTVQLDMTRIDGLIYEFACHEGNAISVTGTLRGARLAEKEGTVR